MKVLLIISLFLMIEEGRSFKWKCNLYEHDDGSNSLICFAIHDGNLHRFIMPAVPLFPSYYGINKYITENTYGLEVMVCDRPLVIYPPHTGDVYCGNTTYCTSCQQYKLFPNYEDINGTYTKHETGFATYDHSTHTVTDALTQKKYTNCTLQSMDPYVSDYLQWQMLVTCYQGGNANCYTYAPFYLHLLFCQFYGRYS